MKPGVAQRGFTLPELVVTLIILAIVSAVVMARLNPTSTDATWFHEQTRSAVRFAQKQAIAQRRSIYVVVAPAQISLCYDAACATPLSYLTRNESFVLAAPAGVLITSSTSPFSFNGLGQASAAVTLSVNGKPISVVAETGYVQ